MSKLLSGLREIEKDKTASLSYHNKRTYFLAFEYIKEWWDTFVFVFFFPLSNHVTSNFKTSALPMFFVFFVFLKKNNKKLVLGLQV